MLSWLLERLSVLRRTRAFPEPTAPERPRVADEWGLRQLAEDLGLDYHDEALVRDRSRWGEQ